MFKAAVIAGVGGGIGTCLRLLSEKLAGVLFNSPFPSGTFIANILGCLLIGIFYGCATKRQWFNEKFRLFLITGLCGGLTTFSTFSFEMISLIQAGDIPMFMLYLSISLIMGLLAVVGGIAIVRPHTKYLLNRSDKIISRQELNESNHS